MLARPEDDSALSDAARWGLDLGPEDLAPLTTDDAVWASNVDAVMAFLSISTQWRVVFAERGLIHTGLDYAGARDGLMLAGIAVTPDLWAGVQTIERGALSAMAEDWR